MGDGVADPSYKNKKASPKAGINLRARDLSWMAARIKEKHKYGNTSDLIGGLVLI